MSATTGSASLSVTITTPDDFTVTTFTMPRWLRLVERADEWLHGSRLPSWCWAWLCNLYGWGIDRASGKGL